MAINPAISSANVANKAAQIGFAQNVTAPKELKTTEDTRRVQTLDEEGLEEQSSVRDGVQQKTLEDASGPAEQRHQPVRRETVDRRTAGTGEARAQARTAQTTQTAQTAQTPPEQAAQQAQPQGGDVAARTLRLALADNSRQLQAQFDSTQPQQGTQQPGLGAEGRRTVMLRNLESMVNMQLAQYTGNEPYSRQNYRQILGALTQMQGGATPASKNQEGVDSRNDQGWQAEDPEHQDGVYKLYSGQAAKTLSFLSPEPERQSSRDPLDLVA